MALRTIVVSAFDKNYFSYYREQLQSLVACGIAEKYDLGVVDSGLTTDQVDWLRRSGIAAVVAPDWPFPEGSDQPSWYKACLCRPFFADYFDAWDIVIYLDADSWFQSSELLDCAVAGVIEDGFAVVPVVDRCHWPLRTPVNAAYSMHWHKDCLIRYYGQEIADRFQLHPILHGSFFAGRKGAPHWQRWRDAMAAGLKRHVHFNVDQASMTLALHESGLPVHFLPISMHWIGHLAPVGLDGRTGLFVEPYQPHRPLSSLTLAADTKTEPVLVRTTDGRLLSRSLRYGQRHATYALNVTIADRSIAFDGLATPRFANTLRAMASDTMDFRRIDITGRAAAEIESTLSGLRADGYAGYATDDGAILAVRRDFCIIHFGIA